MPKVKMTRLIAGLLMEKLDEILEKSEEDFVGLEEVSRRLLMMPELPDIEDFETHLKTSLKSHYNLPEDAIEGETLEEIVISGLKFKMESSAPTTNESVNLDTQLNVETKDTQTPRIEAPEDQPKFGISHTITTTNLNPKMERIWNSDVNWNSKIDWKFELSLNWPSSLLLTAALLVICGLGLWMLTPDKNQNPVSNPQQEWINEYYRSIIKDQNKKIDMLREKLDNERIDTLADQRPIYANLNESVYGKKTSIHPIWKNDYTYPYELPVKRESLR